MRSKKPKVFNPPHRPKLYGVRLLVSLTDEMLADIDRFKGGNETRLDVIRGAIERELERRKRF
jgi:metal-responsive CopG/Arc/MetJ family transcriptional regulator